MIVALRASDGKPLKHAPGNIDAVILGMRTQREDPQAAGELRLVAHQIASNLSLQELVIRHIRIDGVNHPVAIAEGIGIRRFHLGFQFVVGVARQIEPVATPALAVMLGSKQAINHFGEGVGRSVSNEGIDFSGRGW